MISLSILASFGNFQVRAGGYHLFSGSVFERFYNTIYVHLRKRRDVAA